ncbi:MAG: nucleotidyltransferase domain-containing protein [bacterium]
MGSYLAECLEERGINVSKIILFGSHARDGETRESYVDLAVILADFHGKSIFRRADMLGDAELKTIRKFAAPLDMVTMSPEDLESGTSLAAGFVRQGKVIYPPRKRKPRC